MGGNKQGLTRASFLEVENAVDAVPLPLLPLFNAATQDSISGAVYVFTRTCGEWTQQAYVKASNTGSFDRFGSSVALSGDTLAVGAYRESSNGTGGDGGAAIESDNNAFSSGAVYIFKWSLRSPVTGARLREVRELLGIRPYG